jgi:hypothetical protein
MITQLKPLDRNAADAVSAELLRLHRSEVFNTVLGTTVHNGHTITAGSGGLCYWAEAGDIYQGGHLTARSAVTAVKRMPDRRSKKGN